MGDHAVGADGAATAAVGEPRSRPPTIYDVARAAGVSHQTVSRFLTGYPGIRPQTRERVVAALDALGYRPNLTARSLTTGRSHRLGALTHEIVQFGPSRIADGATVAALEAGYLLDVVTIDVLDPRAIRRSLDLITQHDLAGILALSSTDQMTAALRDTEFRVPAVVAAETDDAVSDHPSPLTGVGLPALVRHLAELGHRRLLHIAGPTTWAAARNRARASSTAVADLGLDSVGVVAGDWSARSGFAAVAHGPRGATAVVAANDQMALGAMLALHERGHRVPADVSVTGVDDTPDAAYYHPPLTTLRVDFAAQGRAAVAELLARIEGAAPPAAPVAPSAQLVVRSSTGPAPAS